MTTSRLRLPRRAHVSTWLRGRDPLAILAVGLVAVALLRALQLSLSQAAPPPMQPITAQDAARVILIATATAAPPAPTATPWPTAEPQVVYLTAPTEPPQVIYVPAPAEAQQDSPAATAAPDWYTDIATPEPAFLDAITGDDPNAPACVGPTGKVSPLCGGITNAEAEQAAPPPPPEAPAGDRGPGGSGKMAAPDIGPIVPASGDDAARWCAAAASAGHVRCVTP